MTIPCTLLYAVLAFLICSDIGIIDKHAESLRYQDSLKREAFSVIQLKCNICHATKKKTDIFTLENMDSLAADINKQVFVKSKMPKGRKTKLTENERDRLKAWLGETLIEE